MAIFNRNVIDVRLAKKNGNQTIFIKTLFNRPIRIIENNLKKLGITFQGEVYELNQFNVSSKNNSSFIIFENSETYNLNNCPLLPYNILSENKLGEGEFASRLFGRNNFNINFSYSGTPENPSNFPVLYGENLKDAFNNGLEQSLLNANIKFELRKNYIDLMPSDDLPNIPSSIINNFENGDYSHEYETTFLIEYLFSSLNNCCNFLIGEQYSKVFLSRLIISFLEIRNQGVPIHYETFFNNFVKNKYKNLKCSARGVLKDLGILSNMDLVKRTGQGIYKSNNSGLKDSEKLTLIFLESYYSNFSNI